MSKAKEIKDQASYEGAKTRLQQFCATIKPGPEDVIDTLKDIISIEMISASHTEQLAYEMEGIAAGLSELFQKSSHTFASLNALMHYLKDVGVDKDGKLDAEKYKAVFEEKVVKPYKELQDQIDTLEKKANPFNDPEFGAGYMDKPSDETPEE
jgi:hypothetical protein